MTTTLPTQSTRLIGREAQVREVCDLLRRPDVQLVTLTGVGGTGKTRLGIQVANTLIPEFEDGVYFIPLAPITDSTLVAGAIATKLGLKESGSEPFASLLKNYLRDKRLLLLIDNFEQVIDAAALVSKALAEAANVKVLVTSRSALRLAAEHVYSVPPLALPDLKRLPDLTSLSQFEAVALFIARAQAANPGFDVNAANAPAIAEVCVRLDGLPLAIELAAARMNVLSAERLLARLGNRLQVLTTGTRDAPARQQTLRNTIDWSYNLLNPAEQRLFERLSVFAGGCTLEAAEAVCTSESDGDARLDVLDGLASLVDKSLLRQVQRPEGESRFVMLETIREYAGEQMAAHGEAAALQQRCATYYQRFAEPFDQASYGREQKAWLQRLEDEHDNIRSALRWALESGNIEDAARLATSIRRFWQLRGYCSEGRQWLNRVLAKQATLPEHLRAKTLFAAGRLAEDQSEYPTATALYEESLALARAGMDNSLTASVLNGLSSCAMWRGDMAASLAHVRESGQIFRALNDKSGTSIALNNEASISLITGRYKQAETMLLECLQIDKELDDKQSEGIDLNNLGETALMQTHFDEARQYYAESLAIAQDLGEKSGVALAMNNLGVASYCQGDVSAAQTWLGQSLTLARAIGFGQAEIESSQYLGLTSLALGDARTAWAQLQQALAKAKALGVSLHYPRSLAHMAAICLAGGWADHAARLLGASDGVRQAQSNPLAPYERPAVEAILTAAHSALGEAAFAAAFAAGRALTPEQAADYALSLPVPPAPPPALAPAKAEHPASPNGLTAREVEILKLVAQGLTDQQVADKLFLSKRTVSTHLVSIYGKLGVNSRMAAARWASENGLA